MIKPRYGKTGYKREGRARFAPKRKRCFFCSNKSEVIDYKDPIKLRNYISNRGTIEPRRKTGTCARHQRTLSTAIKRARHLALLPYCLTHIHRTGGVGISH